MSETATVAQDAPTKGNPYVGPRPFRASEPFYGREREVPAVVHTLLSGRVVLLHSPSGAGKTSLIQAAIVPAFAARNFQVCAATTPAFSALRVNLPPPADVDVANRYVYSIVNGLVGHLVQRSDALTMSICEALDLMAAQTPPGSVPKRSYQFVVIDQLEEVLTLDPGDVRGQSEFFRQLGESLDDDRRWALLAMREDYMGGLDRFERYIPGQLRSTFRLDFLDERAALRAVVEPTRERGVLFEEEAAQMLVSELRRQREDRTTTAGPIVSPYVEPVFLQVVCDDLWRKMEAVQGEALTVITVENVRAALPLDQAVSKYYREVMAEAGRGSVATERAVRDWVEEHLITKQSLRRPTRSWPVVDAAEDAVRTMQRRYLIRDDARPGGSWWELSHDMLIVPILEDNRAWRVENLAPWQVAADRWQRSGHRSSYLLRGADYRTAKAQSKKVGRTQAEALFLAESKKATLDASARGRLQASVNGLLVLLLASLALNIFFVVLFYGR